MSKENITETVALAGCRLISGVIGPEDFEYLRQEKGLVVSSLDRRAPEDTTGQLYWIDLTKPTEEQVAEPIQTNYPGHFKPHGLTFQPTADGGSLFVISHPETGEWRHTIEVFSLTSTTGTHEWKHIQTLTDDLLISPNDLVALPDGGLFISNDFQDLGGVMGLVVDTLLQRKRAPLVYYDGTDFTDLDANVLSSAGITALKEGDRDFLYRDMMDKGAQKLEIHWDQPGRPRVELVETIHLNSGADNFTVDEEGAVYVATHYSMTSIATNETTNPNNQTGTQTYAPSWVDRITAWVAGLPGPNWSYYLGLGLVLFLVQAIVSWVEGAFPIGGFDSAQAFLAAAIPFVLALIHYFDVRAEAALVGMRLALKVTEKEYAIMLHKLTTLPVMPTLLAGLAALACVFLLEIPGEPYHREALDPFPISASLLRSLYFVCWWVFGTLVYHTVHQLRQINRTYTQHTRINLFRMKSLYAFSNLSALTAGSLAAIPYAWLFAHQATELIREDPVVLIFYLIVTSFAVVTFLWPQLGIHRLQVAEKERMLDEAHVRFEAIILELHQRVDNGNLEGIGELHTVLASLETERSALDRVPTWPWEPEVLRLLITALALPLGLWFIQIVLQRVLGS